MVELPAGPAPALTYDDLEAMPDDGCQREIIGGSLVVTPAPFGRHQRAVARLTALLMAAETVDTMVICAPYDWRLPSGDSVQPDVTVIRRADFDPDGPLPATATPLLVVEMLSPSNPGRDRLTRRDLYESLRVAAYWIVDPKASSLLALRLSDDRYRVEASVAGGEDFVTDWPFPLRLSPEELGS